MEILCISYGYSMDVPCISYEIPMVFLCISYGLPMVFLCISYDCAMFPLHLARLWMDFMWASFVSLSFPFFLSLSLSRYMYEYAPYTSSEYHIPGYVNVWR